MVKTRKPLKVGKFARRKIPEAAMPVKSAAVSAALPRSKVATEAFPIVGLGASAGGLEALEKFFSQVPPNCGIGFVVVTHLHPGHVSLLPELLGKCTRMPVKTA